MDLPAIPFERYECLEGTWTPMMAMGEDHFIGTVRHFVYVTPRNFTIRIVLERLEYNCIIGVNFIL